MSDEPRVGRPRASSRESIADAACELFLERGYEAASISDIASRAGVSRSSFFNYFASKSDVLWSGLDDRLARVVLALEEDRTDAATAVRRALGAVAEDFAPDSLALAMANASQMRIEGDLAREAAVRRSRVATAVAARLRRDGAEPLAAEVAGAAHAGAVLAAIEAWASAGAGRAPLTMLLDRALAAAAPTLPGSRPPLA